MNRAPPEKRNGPEGCQSFTARKIRSLVSNQGQQENYSQANRIATAASAAKRPQTLVDAGLAYAATGAEIVPFHAHGSTVRAISVVPDGAEGIDLCISIPSGRPLHDNDLCLRFRGPLWKVLMMLKDYRQGLPVHVHPECVRRATQ